MRVNRSYRGIGGDGNRRDEAFTGHLPLVASKTRPCRPTADDDLPISPNPRSVIGRSTHTRIAAIGRNETSARSAKAQ